MCSKVLKGNENIKKEFLMHHVIMKETFCRKALEFLFLHFSQTLYIGKGEDVIYVKAIS
jgi:hypothetical protein